MRRKYCHIYSTYISPLRYSRYLGTPYLLYSIRMALYTRVIKYHTVLVLLVALVSDRIAILPRILAKAALCVGNQPLTLYCNL